jgi:hypothetical protein
MLLHCSALSDCFSISDQYSPATSGLPLFLLYLSTGVDWDEEKGCFDSFCREIARFYSQQLQSDHWDTEHEGSMSQVIMPWAASVLNVAKILYEISLGTGPLILSLPVTLLLAYLLAAVSSTLAVFGTSQH